MFREEVVEVKYVPYAHQEHGINWILEHRACALFWGMG